MSHLITPSVITFFHFTVLFLYPDATIRDELPGFSKKHGKTASDDPELGIYDPFGKVGGGAPLKDSKGHINTNIHGKMRDQTGEVRPAHRLTHQPSHSPISIKLTNDLYISN